jgi:hypothetical protein
MKRRRLITTATVRGLLVAPPIVLLVCAWRMKSADRLDRLWLYGFPLYLGFFVLVVLFLVGSLLLPLKCC